MRTSRSASAEEHRAHTVPTPGSDSIVPGMAESSVALENGFFSKGGEGGRAQNTKMQAAGENRAVAARLTRLGLEIISIYTLLIPGINIA